MHPRKFVRDSVGFVFTQYIVRVTLMLRGLLAARLLGPLPYGAWNAIQILMDYGVLAPFGTQQGLDQMVPPRIVAGDAAALVRVKRAALFNILLLTALFVAGCLGWSMMGSSRVFNAWGVRGVALALVCVVTTNVASYQASIMRSHGDITTVSGWMLLQGAIGGVMGLALTPWLGAWGLLLGWVAGCLVSFGFVTIRSRGTAPLLPAPASEGLDIVQIGFPMFVFTASTLMMRNIDRLIILRFLGTESLGYYSLSVMALTFILYLPDSISYVMYPQLLRMFGESGRDASFIRPRVERVLRAAAVFVPALSAMAYLCARPLVLLLLPKFTPGVGAIRAICFGAAALAFSNFASIVLMTVGRQTMLMPAAIAATALYAGLDLLAVKSGHGITGVAWATLTAYVVNSAVLLTMALTGLGLSGRRMLDALWRLYAPLALAITLAYSLDHWLPWARPATITIRFARLLLASVMFTGLYGLIVHPLARGMGIRQLVSEFNLPVLGPILRRFGDGTSTREDS